MIGFIVRAFVSFIMFIILFSVLLAVALPLAILFLVFGVICLLLVPLKIVLT